MKEKIQAAIKKSVADAGASGVVVNMSGGLDSSVVAALASCVSCKALILPDKEVNDSADKDHALMLAKQLNFPVETHELNSAIDAIDVEKTDKLVYGNLKARLRMLYAYTVANKENRLVLGTGNKTELLLGYFTKYGDGACDLLPIGSLYKTEVVELAKQLSIPEEILSKPPSAGLWPGQTDEKELGADYTTIDSILKLFEENKTVSECASHLNVPEALVHSLHVRVQKNKHKLSAPQVVVI